MEIPCHAATRVSLEARAAVVPVTNSLPKGGGESGTLAYTAICSLRNFRDMNLRWLSSVKIRFVFHIEFDFDFDFGYAIADLDIWYFTIHEYTACVCGERSQCLVTDWPCAVSDHLV